MCPSCGAKRAVKFAEHIHSEVIEDIPHRHTVFTIPKRLRVFFRYDRKLNSILFRAAWGALSEVLGIRERELAAIFAVQTAGDALNFHPHLHRLLADGFALCREATLLSVGRLLFSSSSATPSWIPRIAPHGNEDEIPPTRERVVLHV